MFERPLFQKRVRAPNLVVGMSWRNVVGPLASERCKDCTASLKSANVPTKAVSCISALLGLSYSDSNSADGSLIPEKDYLIHSRSSVVRI